MDHDTTLGMLFNSFEFLIFFPTVCLIYFLLRKNKFRNPFLLIASYYFYMNWEPIYAVLILTSTILTYSCGLLVEKYSKKKKKQKLFLAISMILNLGIIFIFKYFNFINDSIFKLLSLVGLRWTVPNLNILLPVGISFYTFQAVGYSIDVYRGTIKAERSFLTYALFVSFFPQLVAGPIERAKNLLPQFHVEHQFNADDFIEGIKQMIWGFFMKLCIADCLYPYVDAVYNNIQNHNGLSLILATIFFTFQIYCDFAGYSNIAIGAARIMGFRLMQNFRQPYFAISIKEFWKRWHISLSTWFMDYLYIPMGGNRVNYGRYLLNLMITFIVSGLWHGANWTFVIWGALHGTYLILESLTKQLTNATQNKSIISKVISTTLCFLLVSFAWIFFRANSIEDAFAIVGKIFTEWGPLFTDKEAFLYGFAGLLILLIKDTKDNFGLRLNFMHSKFTIVRHASVVILISYILLFGALSGGAFIYFQF